MSFGAFYKNHYDASAAQAQRVLGETRAVVPSSQKVYDAQMGQVSMIGDVKSEEGAWAGLTQMMPLEKKEDPKRRSREEILASMREQMRAPAYDALSEELRLSNLESQREAWESCACTSLPGATTQEVQPPVKQTRDSPFATSLNTTPRDDPPPRGRARIVPAESKDDAIYRRARNPGVPPSTTSPDATFAAISVKDESVYAIGNGRSENFVLRSKPSRRALPSANKLPSEQIDSNPSRRVFKEHTGGGKSSLDATLTAENRVRRAKRFVPGTNKAPQVSVPTGKRRVPPPQSSSWNDETDEQQRVTQVDAPSPRAVEKGELENHGGRAFVEWYCQEYGEMPPPELIRRAAADISATSEPASPCLRFGGLGHREEDQPVNKSRGPRGGDSFSSSSSNKSINTGNSILGRSSTRCAFPPGGTSTLTFSS